MPTLEPEKYYVISGTYDEFKHFVSHKIQNFDMQPNQFVWVGSTTAIRGIRNPHGWFVGSWRDRSNIYEIIHELRTRYFREKIPEGVKEAINEILPSQS